MVRFLERSRGGPALQEPPTRPLSYALTLLSTLVVLAGSAHAQFPGMDENARIGIMGPDGQMQYLPTQDEMAQAASRGTDLSVFTDYAQRRLELLSLVTEIVYVDDDAPVGGDGTSWESAHQSLQDALAPDYSDRLVEIRMAQGMYRPDRFDGVNTMDPEASFTPRYEDDDDPAGIYRITGGYAGLGAPDPDEHDPEQFPTVITGDLNGDDGPDFTNYEDNSLALFSGFNSELHGLVMEHARQAMKGGQGNITIDGCLVQHHAGAEMQGAATFSGSDVLVVKRSTFYKNRSGLYGGGIDSRVLNTAIVSNQFLSNRAHNGGGLFSGGYGLTIAQNNYFAGNVASGPTGSIGGGATVFSRRINANNTFAFNRSEDGPAGGFGFSWINADLYTVFDVYHSNSGHSGTGLNEQFPSLSPFNSANGNNGPAEHHIRGTFSQDWESSESNRSGTYASTLDSIRDNSGEEVLFIDLAGPDGIIGTLDDDPTPRPDSPNIDRIVDLEGAEIALLDYADLNENGIVDESLPFDLLGSSRSIDTPGIGDPNGGIDAGAIEYAGDPNRFDYNQPISGRRVDLMDGCEGDEPIRLYVNASGSASGDGSSWESPLLELTEALDIARTRCGPVEIWIAAGTYLPDFSVPEHRASFRPTSNITLLGGFAGWEAKADERDPKANTTILSGDRFGNDDPGNPDTFLDNSYRVVVIAGDRGGGVIDGVTIQDGYARATSYAGIFGGADICFVVAGPLATGSGVTVLNGPSIVRNCTITRCTARAGVALAATEMAELTVADSFVSGGHRFLPVCPLLKSFSAMSLSGVDSILIRPALLRFENMDLDRFENTTPFDGAWAGNINLSIVRSDINLLGRFGDRGLIRLQSLHAESSIIRSVSGAVSAAEFEFKNSTVVGRGPVILTPIPALPQNPSVSVLNSIFPGRVFAVGELSKGSIAVNSVYPDSNIEHQKQSILVGGDYEVVFLDPIGPDGIPSTGDEDLRLSPGSPAINTGSNALVTSEFDLDGNPRIIGSVVDRGAYEFIGTCTGDVNGDGVIDLADLNRVLANYGQDVPFGDADGDGSVGMADLNLVLAAFGQTCTP